MLYYGGPDYNYFYPGERCDGWGPYNSRWYKKSWEDQECMNQDWLELDERFGGDDPFDACKALKDGDDNW